MKLWKLTDEKGQTHGGCQWGEGVEHTASGEGGLCSAGWLHAYTDPLLAVLLNPIHANFLVEKMQLWECDGDVGKTDHGLKVGCTRLRAERRIELPVVTTEQRVRFAILCAKEVCRDSAWNNWADKWLSGKGRTLAKAAEWAEWAAKAAEAKAAAEAAAAAEWAAAAVESAAEAAAWAAEAAANSLDLPALAREAVEG